MDCMTAHMVKMNLTVFPGNAQVSFGHLHQMDFFETQQHLSKSFASLLAIGLFKCIGDNICLHQMDVCDGIIHCNRSHDDEIFCNLTSYCPTVCQCGGSAIFCSVETLQAVPFVDAHVQVLKLQTVSQNISNWLDTKLISRHTNLIYLSLSNDQILGMSENIFSNQHLIIFLDLSHNYIQNIFPFVFKHNKNLEHLLLEKNLITKLVHSSFCCVETLITLNLSSNKISTMEPGSFQLIKKNKCLGPQF